MSYQYLTQYDSPNFTESNDGREYIVCHWWDDPANNPSFEGVVSHMQNPNSGVSAHYVATGTGRRVACMVSPEDTAWCDGNWYANSHSIGIECDPRCRAEDYDVVAELIANIRSAYGDLPLKRHGDIIPTQCPGNWNLPRLDALARTKDGSGDWGVVTDIKPPTPPVVTPEAPKPIEPPIIVPEPIITPEPVITPPVIVSEPPVVIEPPIEPPVIVDPTEQPTTIWDTYDIPPQSNIFSYIFRVIINWIKGIFARRK